jgi:hypothetical protein
MTQFATVDLNINSGWLEGSDGWKAGMDYNLVALSVFLPRYRAEQQHHCNSCNPYGR